MPSWPTLPGFIGGETRLYRVRFELDDDILDLTDWTYTVEIQWDGLTHIVLTEGEGVERIEDIPDDDEWHFEWALTADQTRDVPLGNKSIVLLSRESPDGAETIIESVNLQRDR